ncbi:type II toxin-antitoxin system HicB family antitoxin [Bradyrhizobium neotropicale]|uniref:type II toxin-antitoxin system HicB family antitoxin n=1 Tax=Bradyrhizobium neotropicale TaxID=1497615 RepID=UPI00289A19EA|nr:type II toxin-antitoxin system HicB family antitoxin [Bradyrhizobium neotropicale]MBO4222336.1 KTSC domain-containing protein [Bradyrhizobium neotropicale]
MSKTASYIALVHKDEDTSYGVSFPDVPGCISAGDSFADALSNASEALAGHLAVMEADGDRIPVAHTLEELERNPDFLDDAAGAVIALVSPASNQVTSLRIELESATIKEIAYESSRRELLVTFASGRRYVYDGVPFEVIQAFKSAASKGSFFEREIRDRFPHREFRERFLVAMSA